MRADWLSVGNEIVARLEAQMGSRLRQVRLAAAIDEIADYAPASPAAWVIWDGDRMIDQAGNGAVQAVDQHWLVALMVRSAKDAAAGGGVAEAAGPLISGVLSALMGWQPTGSRGLRRIDAPRPSYVAGTGVYPLSFAARLIPAVTT